jgi:hypothetical protein
MSRDPHKLRVFHDAHSLTLAIYQHTHNFPSAETYGLRQQIRLELGLMTRDTANALQPACNAVVRQLQRLVSETEILARKDASRLLRRPPSPRRHASDGR